jgi:hypothetical protein
METTGKIIRVGQKIPKEILKQAKAEYREAKKYPLNLKDFPEASPEALDEFAVMARELRKHKGTIKPVIALRYRLKPWQNLSPWEEAIPVSWLMCWTMPPITRS